MQGRYPSKFVLGFYPTPNRKGILAVDQKGRGQLCSRRGFTCFPGYRPKPFTCLPLVISDHSQTISAFVVKRLMGFCSGYQNLLKTMTNPPYRSVTEMTKALANEPGWQSNCKLASPAGRSSEVLDCSEVQTGIFASGYCQSDGLYAKPSFQAGIEA